MTRRRLSLRILAVPLFVLIIIESLVGSELAFENTYSTWVLALHILLALGLIGISGRALLVSWGYPTMAPRIVAGLNLVASVTATAGGTVFLLGNSNMTALGVMEGSAVLIVLFSLIFLAWGTPPAPVAPAAPA
jgi:hypothetical protein